MIRCFIIEKNMTHFSKPSYGLRKYLKEIVNPQTVLTNVLCYPSLQSPEILVRVVRARVTRRPAPAAGAGTLHHRSPAQEREREVKCFKWPSTAWPRQGVSFYFNLNKKKWWRGESHTKVCLYRILALQCCVWLHGNGRVMAGRSQTVSFYQTLLQTIKFMRAEPSPG